MIGNAALDVVIGLVFIYLLYSLYATVLMEMVSSVFGLRARNLSYALSRMLKDEDDFGGNRRKQASARMKTTFLRFTGRSANLKNPKLFDAFFAQPSIKYLSSGGLGNRPSYLSAEIFTKALIDSIKYNAPEVGELLRIQMGLRLWDHRNEPSDTALPPLEDDTDILPDIPPTERSETIRHIQSLLDDANNDLVKFNILLENWYNETMERATGWFKQTTQAILLLIGAALAIGFEVDTVAIFNKLSADELVRTRLAQMATDFTAKPDSLTSPDNRQLARLKTELENDIRSTQNIVGPVKTSVTSFFGYILTILAISLGAPFWFDLLNKLVRLRTSTAAPGTTKTLPETADFSRKAIINRKG